MELQVQKREQLGKQVKSLRAKGLIPAELYGHGFDNIHLNVDAKEFNKIFKQAGESTIINLDLEKEKIPVLIHDVSADPISDKILSIDFYRVRMDEKITANVPLEYLGEAPVVKEKGGILVKSLYEVDVEALPANLPHKIEVDLSVISDIGFTIYLKDLKISKDVKILLDENTAVVTAVEPKKEEVVEKEISVEDVKVEGEEEKKAKEGEKLEESKQGQDVSGGDKEKKEQ